MNQGPRQPAQAVHRELLEMAKLGTTGGTQAAEEVREGKFDDLIDECQSLRHSELVSLVLEESRERWTL